MQYIAIKEEEKNGKICYSVNAIPLKNKNKSVVQKIPHPLGSDVLEYNTLDEAKDSITRAGFSYILPDGRKGYDKFNHKRTAAGNDYDLIIKNTIYDKINSTNSNVAASAILAISEFPEEKTFDILFEKIGEDNDVIRKNAISGICRYGNLLQNRILDCLKSSNWVVRNSALSCISNLVESDNIDLEKCILPLTEVCEDSNTIVQAYALTVLAKAYQNYKKHRAV